MLSAHTPVADHMYALQVTNKSTAVKDFTPGWGPLVYFYAGSWSAQPQYDQLNRPELCQYVGCGPNAWAIFFAWVQRNQGPRPALGWLNTMHPPDSVGGANQAIIYPVGKDLYQLCHVICAPFSDEGASGPGDMMDAGLGETWPSVVVQYSNRSWNMRWTLWDSCPEDGALRCRDAIKKGYPGCVGLGWLWHDAVAYGYAYQQFYLAPNTPYLTARYLKCNMGWGPDDPPRWYNLCDTFFSADFHVTKGPKAP
jgi:hypothetical protein